MDDHSYQPDMSKLNASGINISDDPTATNPFVKTCFPFNNVQSISRQKNVSCEWQREGINQRLYILDCVPFCHIEKLVDILHAMLTVWLVSTNSFRGMWQTDFSIKRKM